MIKVIVTGSNGLLGQSLLNLLLQEREVYEVIGFSRGINRSGRDDFEYVSLDITNEKSLKENIIKLHPDFIIHTAAMTNLDACEHDKNACDVINVAVVAMLVQIATQINTHIIHLSTDFIFDGKKGDYKETDVPNPFRRDSNKFQNRLYHFKNHFGVRKSS